MSNSRIIRAILSRLIILIHLGLTIYIIYDAFSAKTRQTAAIYWIIPMLGAIAILIEGFLILVLTKGKEPTAWFSPMFFIYVSTIVACYWLLELENIAKARKGDRIRFDYSTFRYQKDTESLTKWIRVVWSSLELQIFFGLLIVTRWINPKSVDMSPQGLAELLVKYFVISCDMLDFLTILQDDKLILSDGLTYATLTIWTWSAFQFFIYVPSYEDEEKKEFLAYISNSFLSTIFMDLPYFVLRLVAIFAFGSHNYNSYYFVTKNALMIILQGVRIRAAFRERKIRSDKNVRKLKDRHGIDKTPSGIYGEREFRNNLANRFKNEQQRAKNVQINLDNTGLEVDTKYVPTGTQNQQKYMQMSPTNPMVARLQMKQDMIRNSSSNMNSRNFVA